MATQAAPQSYDAGSHGCSFAFQPSGPAPAAARSFGTHVPRSSH